MSKKSTRVLAIVMAVVIFAGAFYVFYFKPFSTEQTPPASASPAGNARPAAMGGGGPTPVRAMVIQTGSLVDAISVTGSTIPESEVVISSEVPGKVAKILFQEGTFVKKGASLITLDDEELRAQRDRLVVQQELAQKIAQRLKGLYDKEGVSLQEYEVAAAEAKQVTAEINLIDVQLEKRTIRAPFSGILGLKQVSEGSYLSPGSPIVSLVSTNPIHIEFSIPEKYSSSLNRGSKINFQIDGLRGNFQATVFAREPNIDPTTRTLRLKASAPNPNGAILPGAFAAVNVNLQAFERAIMVPTQAIIPELGGKKVFVLRNGVAESVSVETGIRKDVMIQIVDGLRVGDTLITTGVLQLRQGSPVSVTQLDQAEQG